MSDNGALVLHGSDYHKDYFTDVIANRSYEFLANTSRDHPDDPWFMYLATPASHGPDTCAPQYCGETFDNATAPRNPNYNHWSGDKHVRQRARSIRAFHIVFLRGVGGSDGGCAGGREWLSVYVVVVG